MKVINLIGGPCVGKSTSAARLFAEMKAKGYSVELVTEYAKQLTLESRSVALGNQVYILGKQNHALYRVKESGFDYAVSDAPLILGLVYKTNSLSTVFDALVLELFNSYDNINLMLDREFDYQSLGRNQSLEEALIVDERIKTVLSYHRIDYTLIKPSQLTFELDNILKVSDGNYK